MLRTGACLWCPALGAAQRSLVQGRRAPVSLWGRTGRKPDRAAVAGGGRVRSCWRLEAVPLAPAHLWAGVFSEEVQNICLQLLLAVSADTPGGNCV